MDAARHNSFIEKYRRPFGAVGNNTEVTISIEVLKSITLSGVWLCLKTEQGGVSEYLMPREAEDGSAEYYTYTQKYVTPNTVGLCWYYFRINESNGKVWYYGRLAADISGLGRSSDRLPAMWQITIFELATTTPSWFRHGVIYQIFVDRYYNGHPEKKVDNLRKQSLVHAHWDNEPLYIKDPDSKRVIRWDFFGGNLLGVKQKLAYLKNMGITIIYLNPIFEAASNHKYDTGDYKKIDPGFGDNQLFRELCLEAKKYGIRIILDGVFSHTGSDSIYFNREGNYDSVGAYQSPDSKWYKWFKFEQYPDQYESWWGVDVMPNVNELEPSYQDYIINDEDSVLQQWLDYGASGWRLDVADELPDAFIKNFWEKLKKINNEAVLIGEVWEDASNKVSYGEQRKYLNGGELDSVMNYPFKDIALGYMKNEIDAQKAYQNMMLLLEHYPKIYFYSMMNLLGTHDTVRLFTELSEDRQCWKQAIVWQMTYPGVPSIYYGDDTGLTGGKDPMNRKTYPWGNDDIEMVAWCRELIALRNNYQVFTEGEFKPFVTAEGCLGWIRYCSDTNQLAVAVFNQANKSLETNVDLSEFFDSGTMYDSLYNWEQSEIVKGNLKVALTANGYALYIRDRWLRQDVELRAAGVLLHVSSLAATDYDTGIGDMGLAARNFIDKLFMAKQTYWQILPLQQPGYGESPYQTLSSFAGNVLLIDLLDLADKGLLEHKQINIEDTKVIKPTEKNKVNYVKVKQHKIVLLEKAYKKWLTVAKEQEKQIFYEFIKAEQWLIDYATFMSIKKQQHGIAWHQWPKELANRNKQALSEFQNSNKAEVESHCWMQWVFFRQWFELKDYAAKHNIEIIGDLPIYVAHDSCDVWVDRQLFDLDVNGQLQKVAGVPPDYFSDTGQRWGNPLYLWDVHAQDGYAWWINRVKHNARLVDHIRIDHFRGFADYWAIDADSKTAVKGQWLNGPGEDFFQYFKEYSLIAEDLGELSQTAVDLKLKTSLPGMQILQFAFNLQRDTRWPYSLADSKAYAYSGTHDNATLEEWLESNNSLMDSASLLELMYNSDTENVIIPMQDLLELGAGSRMNTPGTTEDNWVWRCPQSYTVDKRWQWLAEVTVQTNRVNDNNKNRN